MKNKTLIIAILSIIVIITGIFAIYINTNKKSVEERDNQNSLIDSIENVDNNEDDDLDFQIELPTNTNDDDRIDKLEFDKEDYVSNYENSLRDRESEENQNLPKIPEEAITNEGGEIKISISDNSNITEKILDNKNTTE